MHFPIPTPRDANDAVRRAFIQIHDAFSAVGQDLTTRLGPVEQGVRSLTRDLADLRARVEEPFQFIPFLRVERFDPLLPVPGALYGLHADRLTTSPGEHAEGILFWETDRAALYQVQLVSGTKEWVLLMCRPLRTSAARPGDLGTNDTGFTWFQSTGGYEERWSGTNWNFYRGSLVDTFANIPDPALADRGFLFIASDFGEHVWRKGATQWELLEGVGGPMRGTLSPDQKPAAGTLETANITSVGFRFFSTDFDREYRFDGVAYADSPGQPMRGQIVYFTSGILPGTGWALCDNTAGVARSTSTGGTTTFTTPDITTNNRFIRAVSGATGGQAGSVTHTHKVNPPSTTSGNNSATQEVQSGTGVIVAANPHTHDTDIAEFSSGNQDFVDPLDGLPPFINLRPYIRL